MDDQHPDGEERPIPGFGISGHWADGYAFGDKGFVHVPEAVEGSLVIESGRPARLTPDDAEDWRVAGRGSGHEIALWRQPARSGTGSDHPDFCSLDLRSFLVANPAFLHGQLVEHDGETRRVVVDDRGRVTLRRKGESTLIGIDELVDQHLDALRARTVIIVDKG